MSFDILPTNEFGGFTPLFRKGNLVLCEDTLDVLNVLVEVAADVPILVSTYQEYIKNNIPDSDRDLFLSLFDKLDLGEISRAESACKGLNKGDTILKKDFKKLHETSCLIETVMYSVLHQAKRSHNLDESVFLDFTDLLLRFHNANCGPLDRWCQKLIKNWSVLEEQAG